MHRHKHRPKPYKFPLCINHTALRCDKRHIGIPQKSIHHQRQLVRQQHVVIHQPLDVFALGKRVKYLMGLFLRRHGSSHIAYARIREIVLHQLLRAVVCPKIANNDLNIGIGLCERTFKSLPKIFRTVIGHDKDADERRTQQNATAGRMNHLGILLPVDRHQRFLPKGLRQSDIQPPTLQ